MRSGYININLGFLGYAGINGYGWSSRAYSTTTGAYYLYFNASNVYPSNAYNRWGGFPLRCLSTAVD